MLKLKLRLLSTVALVFRPLPEENAALAVKHDFKPGDIVRWKNGLKIHAKPPVGAPMIVLRISTVEEFERLAMAGGSSAYTNTGSPHFGDVETLVVLFQDGDGEALTFWVPPNRVEPIPADELVIG